MTKAELRTLAQEAAKTRRATRCPDGKTALRLSKYEWRQQVQGYDQTLPREKRVVGIQVSF